MKVLNLYAGIGGNRKLWPKDCEVTAIENNREIANIYANNFPRDRVIITNAVEYLLAHYSEYEFIWLSPPCPSHSTMRYAASKKGDYPPILPDMSLYGLIIFLKHFCKSTKWVVENVTPYYKPLIEPSAILGRHFFWSNFKIPVVRFRNTESLNSVYKSSTHYGFNISNEKLKKRRDQVLKNCVNPQIGLYVLNCAINQAKITLKSWTK